MERGRTLKSTVRLPASFEDESEVPFAELPFTIDYILQREGLFVCVDGKELPVSLEVAAVIAGLAKERDELKGEST